MTVIASGGVTRVTVNLTRAAHAAMNEAAKSTGYSRTDTINQALFVYAELARARAEGYDEIVLLGPRSRWLRIVKKARRFVWTIPAKAA